MIKRNKIIYWIATIWLALGMLSTGIVQFINMKEEADMMTNLGYPLYFMTILSVWKILGVAVVLTVVSWYFRPADRKIISAN